MTTVKSKRVSTTPAFQIPEMHSKFLGSAERLVKKQIKKKIYGEVKNLGFKPDLLWLPLDSLIPLETQRTTDELWVSKRLDDCRGIDMLAFGALSVAKDPDDGLYYLWDGCGRAAMAQANSALDIVPCLVYDMPKKQAAYYFAYNQDRGRRSLSKEAIFVNAHESGDEQALLWGQRLAQLGCYIEGNTGYPVPHPAAPGHVEIRYRALTEGYAIAEGDMQLQRQVRDIIVAAWNNNPNGCTMIHQDIYWAILKTFVLFPSLGKPSKKHNAFIQFLNNQASGQNQDKIQWKPKGMSGNAGIANQLAHGLISAFKGGAYWDKAYGAGELNATAIQNLIK